MRSRVRALEGRLLLERIRVVLRSAPLAYLSELRRARAAGTRFLPDGRDFEEIVLSSGLKPSTLPRAVAYIDRCLARREDPDANQLLKILQAWRFEDEDKVRQNETK
jgi:hypothetical protein